MELEVLLKKNFQFSSFRPGQRETVAAVLNGRHTLAMLPTGTGKSLCYQLPAYQFKGMVLVVTPLLSLMQDQVEQILMRGEKRVVAMNSFLSGKEKMKALANLEKFRFVFISPEMLGNDLVMERLKNVNIELFVVDEAHCISQWGYDFRPDYLKLGEARSKLGNPLTLALTATAAKEVRNDIIRSLGLASCEQIIFSVDRPSISLAVEHLPDYQEKSGRLLELAKELEGPGVIYFSSKKTAEQTAAMLAKNGVGKAMAYHGGMEQENRILIQQQFINGQIDIVCATSAFGMGINKENIRFVIHYHMPQQLESYLQEIGRAGRDGKESIAVLLYALGDEQLPRLLAEGELPSKIQTEMLFAWLERNTGQLGNLDSFAEELQNICGFNETQWRIARGFIGNDGKRDIDLEQLKRKLQEFVRQRLATKTSKITEMVQWVHSEGCRRKYILEYFDEQAKAAVANCCSFCGIDRNLFLKAGNMESSDKAPFHWKKHLTKLLLNE